MVCPCLTGYRGKQQNFRLLQERRGWAGREGGDSDAPARKGEQMADKPHTARTFYRKQSVVLYHQSKARCYQQTYHALRQLAN